jgi:asparagine synthase (glutamine-hydrolysing)
MCGIFGAINLNGKFQESEYQKFVGLTDVIAYRGPDSSGYEKYSATESTGGFNVFLGHRRLSIIDLSEAGKQPMEFDGLSIIFNGEIFNYIELRESLKKLGHVFKTDTDTEVIIRTYQHFGDQGFSSFNGMWSFILFDKAENKVIVSRDRFSIKPLYYLEQDGCYYFSSELKQLTPLLHKKSLNKDIMYNFLNQAVLEHNENTFFEGIQKVKPCHNLVLNLDTQSATLKKYWAYQLENSYSNEGDVIEKFRELFTDSIKIRLRSDVKIGALLSGGLDSSAICAIADKIMQGNFETFSIISDDKRYSEEYFIDELVKKCNIKNTKLGFEPSMVLNRIGQVLYHQDEPFAGLSIVAQYLIFEKIKKASDITVVLSGQGGDEALMGYLKYFFFNLQDNFRKGNYLEVLKQASFSLLQRTVMAQFRLGEAKRYIPFLVNKNQSFLEYKGEAVDTWSFNNLIERQVKDIDLFSVPALAHYEDRNSMAFSLESRLPFLDHRLVNFLLCVPVNLKLKNGWTKYLLRKSIHEMPDSIRWRRDKKGFSTPEEEWLKKELKPLFEASFKGSILAQEGIIDEKKLSNAYQGFLSGKTGVHYRELMRVLLAELWMKKQFEKVSVPHFS